jgi:hypothetical protein
MNFCARLTGDARAAQHSAAQLNLAHYADQAEAGCDQAEAIQIQPCYTLPPLTGDNSFLDSAAFPAYAELYRSGRLNVAGVQYGLRKDTTLRPQSTVACC